MVIRTYKDSSTERKGEPACIPLPCFYLSRRKRGRAMINGTKHGHARRGQMTKEFMTWLWIIDRCRRPNSKSFAEYGGAGIDICQEWAADFSKFYEHIGDAPTAKHQIDRINTLGGYEPGNVRWVTPSQNAMNKRCYKNNLTGLKGVGISHNGKYRARVHAGGKNVFSKTFATAKEAAEAYNKAALKYHGEFACLNDLEATK